MIILCRKAWNAYEAGIIWSNKDGVKVVTTMFIQTWNEHLDIQANKINKNHLYAQHLTNA